MSNGNEIDVQRVIREKQDDRGISLKAIAAKSGIPYTSFCGYFPGNERDSTPKPSVELPVSAFNKLCGALPNDLLNLLIPDGFAIVEVPAGVDYDDFSARCRDFVDTKEKAHHPESEAGRDIGPTEGDKLGEKAVQLRVVA
jgi:hypothetical protein